jgi:hypothetical protein
MHLDCIEGKSQDKVFCAVHCPQKHRRVDQQVFEINTSDSESSTNAQPVLLRKRQQKQPNRCQRTVKRPKLSPEQVQTPNTEECTRDVNWDDYTKEDSNYFGKIKSKAFLKQWKLPNLRQLVQELSVPGAPQLAN